MADSPNAYQRWQTEWRRNGAGIMAATFLVGGTWVSASQTFVTARNKQLVHPSPWGWLLYLCIVGFALGLYAWLGTYVEKLPLVGWGWPMLGRAGAKSERDRERFSKSIQETRTQLERLDSPTPLRVEVSLAQPVPFLAPVEYQVAQYRQVLAKMSEAGITEFYLATIDGGLRVVPRTGTDPSYEPLRCAGKYGGVQALIDSGELIEAKPGHYALPSEGDGAE